MGKFSAVVDADAAFMSTAYKSPVKNKTNQPYQPFSQSQSFPQQQYFNYQREEKRLHCINRVSTFPDVNSSCFRMTTAERAAMTVRWVASQKKPGFRAQTEAISSYTGSVKCCGGGGRSRTVGLCFMGEIECCAPGRRKGLSVFKKKKRKTTR